MLTRGARRMPLNLYSGEANGLSPAVGLAGNMLTVVFVRRPSVSVLYSVGTLIIALCEVPTSSELGPTSETLPVFTTPPADGPLGIRRSIILSTPSRLERRRIRAVPFSGSPPLTLQKQIHTFSDLVRTFNRALTRLQLTTFSPPLCVLKEFVVSPPYMLWRVPVPVLGMLCNSSSSLLTISLVIECAPENGVPNIGTLCPVVVLRLIRPALT